MARRIVIKNGVIQTVYSDDLFNTLKGIGEASVKRASHVEYSGPEGWTADMSPFTGKSLILGPFPTRQQALDAEVVWLNEHLPGGLCSTNP